jgi:hypothetical protein
MAAHEHSSWQEIKSVIATGVLYRCVQELPRVPASHGWDARATDKTGGKERWQLKLTNERRPVSSLP